LSFDASRVRVELTADRSDSPNHTIARDYGDSALNSSA
jgi:hypothetical protein